MPEEINKNINTENEMDKPKEIPIYNIDSDIKSLNFLVIFLPGIYELNWRTGG